MLTETIKKSPRKTLFGVLGILAFALIGWALPIPESLQEMASNAGYSGRMAMGILGTVVFAIFWWAGDVMANWLVALIMQCLWILFGYTDLPGAFHSFTNSTIWLFMALFCMATAINKTGLLRRIALQMMRLFSPTFFGQTLALLITGLICSPLIPSATAKIVLGSLLAENIADAMGYENESKGRYGLFIAALVGFAFLCPAFMSAGTNGYAMLGTLPEEISSEVTYGIWLLSMLPWLLIVVIGIYGFIIVYYRPKELASISKENLNQKIQVLGKMSSNERTVMVIMTVCLFFWIFEKSIGLNATLVALSGAVACFATGLLESKEISTAPPWALILFVGGALNIGFMFSLSGLNNWFQVLLLPIFEKISNIYLLIALIMLAVIILRLFIVSLMATITLTMTILIPILQSIGINPFGIGLVIYASMLCWFTPYQNLVYVPGLKAMNGTIKHRGTIPACIVYEALSLIAFLLSVPFWKMLYIL